jgi:hypothetical protein
MLDIPVSSENPLFFLANKVVQISVFGYSILSIVSFAMIIPISL